jgi:hypothetical protein
MTIMSGFRLDERARLSIELALTAGSTDALLLEQQDATAKRLGMTGAEIDIARQGSSFEFLTSRAIALALATTAEDRAERRASAVKAGIDGQARADIEKLAASLGGPPHKEPDIDQSRLQVTAASKPSLRPRVVAASHAGGKSPVSNRH